MARDSIALVPDARPRYPSYPSPARQMTVLAADARERGLSFEEWWEEAVRPGRPAIVTTTPLDRHAPGAVVWPSDSADGKLWRIATAEVKDGWRRAYERLAVSRSERALFLLGPLLDEDREPVAA